MKLYTILLGAALALGLAGCEQTSTADTQQRQAQEELSKQSNMVVGMPAVSNFFEKRLLKTIIEMRDNPKLNTYTYVVDLNGKLHKKCDSIGYGIPYSTQFTNPERVAGYSEHPYTLPQADPNGLFSPPSAEGTWVLCHDPKSDKLFPVYFEPRVVVSPFELPED